MDGLADYDKNEGFVDGAVTLTWQTKEMTNDRGRRLVIDENDVNMSGFVLAASIVAGELQRTKVLPEMDAYRYSTISTLAIDNGQATGGYVPSESTILKKLYYDIAAVQDVVGDNTPLVITMATKVAAIRQHQQEIRHHGFQTGRCDPEGEIPGR